MRNFYILAFGISLLFLIHIIYKAGIERSLRFDMYSEWENNGYNSGSYDEIKSISFNSSIMSLPFIIFYLIIFSVSFKHIKTNTAKVMNILGLSFSALVFLIVLLPIIDSGKISFEELSYLLIPYLFAIIAFCIVNLIQANKESDAYNNTNQFTVDDLA